jgi:ribonuclease G
MEIYTGHWTILCLNSAMPTELLINVLPTEIRIAYSLDGKLLDLLIVRLQQPSLVGAIYRGRICRLLPALQAAFVEIGTVQTAFLPVRNVQDKPPLQRAQHGMPPISAINHCLYEGQSLWVQVMKDPLGTKGPQLTTRITLTGRYLVLLPQQKRIQVSRRINSLPERERLISIVTTYSKGALGWMIRSAATGADAAAMAHEIGLLQQQWQMVLQADHAAQGIKKLYDEPSWIQRIMYDYATADLLQIVVDCQTIAAQLMSFSRQWMPEICPKIKGYQGPKPLFQHFGLEPAIQEALGHSVALPSGGYLLIEQTSALTTIDVNSGSFVGARDHAMLILQTNLEAAQAIAQQLRLRNLGGIIVIDFIDMLQPTHQQQVLAALQQALARDRVQTTLGSFSPLGLVEMTRQRVRDSLTGHLGQICPRCRGSEIFKDAPWLPSDTI